MINWGIIGCGDVTEVKSGPAFNKVNDSRLVAVMRRDAAKAEDYARRHAVPSWYTDAYQLINDPAVNAIYVATPPSSHEEYTIAALHAGKPVYVEKPMSLNAASAKRMADEARHTGQKLVVAHYRRKQPIFKTIKEIILAGDIGNVLTVRLDLLKSFRKSNSSGDTKLPWRLDPAISGGGFFHDLAPHQLDILFHLFGETQQIHSINLNQARNYDADDCISTIIKFNSGVVGNALWNFSVSAQDEKDECTIIGSTGSINFSFFKNQPVLINSNGKSRSMQFEPLPHVQQPMIESVVNYFLNREPNPCSGEEGVTVMTMIDKITGKQ